MRPAVEYTGFAKVVTSLLIRIVTADRLARKFYTYNVVSRTRSSMRVGTHVRRRRDDDV